MESINNTNKNPWYPLFITNFLSVFNDNLIKWLVIYVGAGWTLAENKSTVVSIANALLVIPFIFFSPLAGKLSKMYSKRKIMIIGKIAELPIVIIAITGFYLQQYIPVMLAILLMGLQSSLFSPSKYGLIKEIRGEQSISFGTGVMEMLAFLGVLLATIFASFIADNFTLLLMSVGVLLPATLGIISSVMIKANESQTEKSSESINPVLFIVHNYKFSKNIKGLNNAIFGSALFWLLGSLITMNLPMLCPANYKMSNTETSIAIALAAIGIAAGSVLIGLVSNKKVRMGYVFIGAMGLSVSMLIISLFNPNKIVFLTLLFFASFSSGIFKIPLNSFIQAKVEGRQLGNILAFQNIMEFSLISVSALIFWIISYLTNNNGLMVFLSCGLISLAAALYYILKVEEVRTDFKRILRFSKI